MIPTYRKGQTVNFDMESRQEGTLHDVVVTQADFYSCAPLPNQTSWKETVQSTQIKYPSSGVSRVSYTIPFTWSAGTYKIVWSFKAGGIPTKFTEVFQVADTSWEFDKPNRANYDVRFYPMHLNFKQGSKEYLRILCKEVFDRTYVISSAKYRLIYVKSQYSITKGEWADMLIENGNQLMVLLCTANMEVGKKWFVQIKLDMDTGESILSPEMQILIT